MSKETFLVIVRMNNMPHSNEKAVACYEVLQDAHKAWEIAKAFVGTFCAGGKIELLTLNETLISSLTIEFPHRQNNENVQ